MNGLFISFEGIDGAGKSTHIGRLAEVFRQQGRAVTLSREPGGTPLAEHLRALVLNQPMDAMTEALLVFAARRDHLQQVIASALELGEVVLCDRFSDASFAYQGGGRGFDWEVLCALERWVQGRDLAPGLTPLGALLQPDLTLWFDLDPVVAAQRLAGARAPDRFESETGAFFARVVQGYQRRCDAAPGRFARIPGDRVPEAVWDDVATAVRAKGWLA